MIHQGEAFRVVLNRHKVSLVDLAEKIKMSRTAIYNWFEMVQIPYENLEKCSDALGVDLFEEIKEELRKSEGKFYKPIDSPQAAEKARAFYYSEKMQVNVVLDGSEDHLEATFAKLRAMNKALEGLTLP
jgi:transcriptional regulator with XRE-family HTH domain